MDLNFFEKGDPKVPAVVLVHGILGASRNLYRLAEKISQQNYRVIAYDQPGHGHSKHLAPNEYRFETLALSLFQLLDHLQINSAHLIGHSLGGRVCLTASGLQPSRISSLTMLDVGIKIHPKSYAEIRRIIESLPEFFSSKEEAEAFMKSNFDELQMQQFLLANLRVRENKLTWIFDLNGIRNSLLPSLQTDQTETWKKIGKPTLLARGENSKHFRQTEMDEMLILNPNAKGVLIANAQHWVHADNFEGTLKVILEFLNPLR